MNLEAVNCRSYNAKVTLTLEAWKKFKVFWMTYRTYWTLHHMFWFNSICIWIHIWYTWIVIFYKTSSTWIYECCTRKNTLLMDSNIVDECKSSLIKNNQAVITWSLWMLVSNNEEGLSLYLKYANNTWK